MLAPQVGETCGQVWTPALACRQLLLPSALVEGLSRISRAMSFLITSLLMTRFGCNITFCARGDQHQPGRRPCEVPALHPQAVGSCCTTSSSPAAGRVPHLDRPDVKGYIRVRDKVGHPNPHLAARGRQHSRGPSGDRPTYCGVGLRLTSANPTSAPHHARELRTWATTVSGASVPSRMHCTRLA